MKSEELAIAYAVMVEEIIKQSSNDNVANQKIYEM
jgi:hypothetical protein